MKLTRPLEPCVRAAIEKVLEEGVQIEDFDGAVWTSVVSSETLDELLLADDIARLRERNKQETR